MIIGKKDRDRFNELLTKEDDYDSIAKENNKYIKKIGRLNNTIDNLKLTVSDLEKTVSELNDVISKYKEEDKVQVKELNATKKKLTKTTANLKNTQTIDFGQEVKELNISYKELASKLGISVSTLTKYRKDPLKMSPERYKDIKKKLSRLHMHKCNKVLKG